MLDNPICVALDAPTPEANRALAREVGSHAGLFKVGSTAYLSAGGGDLVTALAETHPVFLDLKLHDIPAQVAGAAAAIARLGVAYTTVHAAGGRAMISAAVAGAGDTTVLAVTILTSLAGRDLDAIGMAGPPEEAVLRLGRVALEAGAGGLVCSAHEVAPLRAAFGPASSGGPLLVVPGIRLPEAAPDDQRRTMGPAEAIAAGADVLVVGRPITEAHDRPQAAASMLAAARAAVS